MPPDMTSEALKALFLRLYGEDFIPAAQRELQVDQATIYRWLSGARIPGPVVAWAKLKSKIVRRS
jgi:hypothetical protein